MQHNIQENAGNISALPPEQSGIPFFPNNIHPAAIISLMMRSRRDWPLNLLATSWKKSSQQEKVQGKLHLLKRECHIRELAREENVIQTLVFPVAQRTSEGLGNTKGGQSVQSIQSTSSSRIMAWRGTDPENQRILCQGPCIVRDPFSLKKSHALWV